ncbi:unnamed protein product [Blepharisma stoltei]|uniref:Phosphatidic acid phosphatase type 2/haloperoxidase domain-containing protein n=1 Tax=Blepharisma stoltei TaxID=1481888 RepID=A0AAU9JGR2_9CILI|nr:unnamed protein product [Blepharisma stoltei]
MKKHFSILPTLILLCLAIGLDIGFKYDLKHSGTGFTEEIQDGESLGQDIISFIFVQVRVVITLLIWYMTYEISPALGMEIIIVWIMSRIFTDIAKLLYADPRPYWYDDDIEAKECNFDWGNPSGHTLGICTVLIYAAYKLKNLGIWKYPVVGVYILYVGYIRVYFGEHFYSQVVLALFFAVFIINVVIVYEKELGDYVSSLNTSKPVIILHLACTGIYTLGAFILLVRFPGWGEDWTDNIDDECDQDIDEWDAALETLAGLGAIFYACGASLGYYCLNQYHLDLWYNVRSSKKSLGRLGLLILGILITHFFFFIFIYGTYQVLALFIIIYFEYVNGFLFMFIIPYISEKLKLNKEPEERPILNQN